ncbi:MAG: hypothetical protein NWP47_05390 [Rickettsiaceae bacterium]|nr:hypothetical protein [Rickettsiaceae bacterium]
MQANNTRGSSSGSISGENIVSIVGMGVSLCLSIITFLTTILTCTYIALKSKFRDKQKTDIEISTETPERSAKIKISLLNNETYSLDTKNFNNKKEIKNRKSDKNSKDNDLDIGENDLDEVLSNNYKGDVIIAETRGSVTTNALNTFLKAAQIGSLGNGDNKAVLDVSAIRIVTNNGSNANVQEIDPDTGTVKIDILGEAPE